MRLEKKGMRPVTQRQADSVARAIKAAGDKAYYVSAKTQQGLHCMMTAAVQSALTCVGLLKTKNGVVTETIVKMSIH